MVERDVERLVNAEVRAALAPILLGVTVGVAAAAWLAWRRFAR